LKVKPDAVLTSPWLRAVQTAEIFCEVIGFSSKKIMRVDALKGTSTPADLFRELAKLEGKRSVLLRPRTSPAPGDRASPAYRGRELRS
jgi:phosphohistidine phosphatase SixA